MSQPAIPEYIVTLTHTLVETPHLRVWFYSLEKLPDWRRHIAFRRMAARMHTAGEDRDLVTAIAMVAQPRINETVLAVVRERVDEASRHT